MKIIDRTLLESWAKTAESKLLFPLLISRLIRASTPQDTWIDMPWGSGVYTNGYDGEVKCSMQTAYVPEGNSVWEFGTEKTNNKKSKGDYDSRTMDSLGYELSTTTFVFATPTFWNDKKKFEREKLAEGKWKNVLALDSSIISQWLTICPAVAKWFLNLTSNVRAEGIKTAEEFRLEWFYHEKATLPPITVTAGRVEAQKSLYTFLNSTAGILGVQAPSKNEAIAFIIASAQQVDDAFKEQFFSKTLIIQNSADYEVVAKNHLGLNLIINFHDRTIINAGALNGHHLIVPLGADEIFEDSPISLPPISREGFEQALSQLGFNEFDASRYAKECGGNINVLRRLLHFPGTQLDWANFKDSQSIIPALLIGKWSKDYTGDLELLAYLSGKSYEDFYKDIAVWQGHEVPPVLQVDHSWRLTSPLDSWYSLSPFLSDLDIKKLEFVFNEVFLKTDDNFESETGFLSSPVKTKYSREVRSGILQSLILIAIHGDRLKIPEFKLTQNWVDRLVTNLLGAAPKNKWLNLSHELSLLAEASPESFLKAVDYSIDQENGVVQGLFSNTDGAAIFSTHAHAYLLWALEGLAWMPEYFPQAIAVLAKLASLDLEYKIQNSPMISLKEILNPAFPQTNASFNDRNLVMEALVDRYPEIAWIIMAEFLENDHMSGSLTQKFRWRKFEVRTEYLFLPDERHDAYEHITSLLVKIYDDRESKFNQLINISVNLELGQRKVLLEFLRSRVANIIFDKHDSVHKLRALLSRHRAKPKFHWCLSDKELVPYEDIYQVLEQMSDSNSSWLFDESWPSFLGGQDYDDLHSHGENLRNARIDFLTKVYEEQGLKAILKLALEVKETGIFGETLAYVIKDDDAGFEIANTLVLDDRYAFFISNYFARLSILHGLQKVVKIFNRLTVTYPGEVKTIRLFIWMIQNDELIDFVTTLSPLLENALWSTISVSLYGASLPYKIIVIEKLCDVERYRDCFKIIAHCVYNNEDIPSGVVSKVLFAANETPIPHRLDKNEILKAFDMLYKQDVTDDLEMMKLEWIYLKFLGSSNKMGTPWKIYQKLASDPVFFVDMISILFRSEDPLILDTEEQLANIDAKYQYARTLFEDFRLIPGVEKDVVVDEDFLKKWVLEVRQLAKEKGRLRFADSNIGKLLSRFPRTTTSWPPEVICEILEKSHSSSMLSSFRTEIFNSRGATIRGPFDGGAQERVLVDQFNLYAANCRIKYPKLSEIFKYLAKGYESHALEEDQEAYRSRLDT